MLILSGGVHVGDKCAENENSMVAKYAYKKGNWYE